MEIPSAELSFTTFYLLMSISKQNGSFIQFLLWLLLARSVKEGLAIWS